MPKIEIAAYLENTFENTLDECDGWLDSAEEGNEDSLSSFSPAIFSIHASGYERRFSIWNTKYVVISITV